MTLLIALAGLSLIGADGVDRIRTCDPSEVIDSADGVVTTAADVVGSPDLGLVQVVDVQVKDRSHAPFVGHNSGTCRVKVIASYRGATPPEGVDIAYSWFWSDDGEATGFLPELGHVYLFSRLDASSGKWFDTTRMECLPRP
ncbi:hypothetical protein QO010_002900 [Caulobacter ginsengisoli]|uniref:Uncharacterized protein n=1 Tax=Caulobacter ginsengisoli TaxID=400775 RepID=A0ABU0ISY4_9CAUL|nr:hypothetical protein [Caulobacter ginsengisoli]MDQ0465116.1 hypothetical protein [Caulobacter ginsengisoli]